MHLSWLICSLPEMDSRKTFSRKTLAGLRSEGAALVRMVYVLCLAVGTYTHASILVRHGWRWNYGGKPIGTVVFWSALTVLDPLVAVLLFVTLV